MQELGSKLLIAKYEMVFSYLLSCKLLTNTIVSFIIICSYLYFEL